MRPAKGKNEVINFSLPAMDIQEFVSIQPDDPVAIGYR